MSGLASSIGCSTVHDNDVGDCAIFLGGLSPAVMLLVHLQDRNPDQFYAPTSIVPILAQAWTPQLSSEVLDRTVALPGRASGERRALARAALHPR